MHINRIGGVMVSMLASSAVDRGFKHRSGQTKDYKKILVPRDMDPEGHMVHPLLS
jgi:hypothetical protein